MTRRITMNLLLQFIVIANNICIKADSAPISTSSCHIRKGFQEWGEKVREYKFVDVAEDVGYIKTFPLDKIKGSLSNDLLQHWNIYYHIFTSIEDAELAIVEYLEMSSLYMKNIIDYPLSNGPIGDNCWHQLSVGAIHFLRNNALVAITPKTFDSSIDTTNAEWLAKEVDRILIESQKVDNANLIQAPEIQSVEILSELPKNWDGTVEVKINASDQKSQQLYYRKYATGFAIVSETGLLTISFNKNTDLLEDTSKARVKIWVWNEDYLTSSTIKEIPF